MTKPIILLDFDGVLSNINRTTHLGKQLMRQAHFFNPKHSNYYKLQPVFVDRKGLDAKLARIEIMHAYQSGTFEGANELITFLNTHNYKWAVVTNNAPECVITFAKKMDWHIPFISGREPNNFANQKPHPHHVDKALAFLDPENKIKRENVYLIGDTVKDIGAAHNAKINIISIAHTARDASKFFRWGTSAIVSSTLDAYNLVKTL